MLEPRERNDITEKYEKPDLTIKYFLFESSITALSQGSGNNGGDNNVTAPSGWFDDDDGE